MKLFGSVRRDDVHPSSDVDLLVTFEQPVGLFEFIDPNQYLEELLGCRVDLGTPRSLKPYLKEHVLQEAVDVAWELAESYPGYSPVYGYYSQIYCGDDIRAIC